MGLLSPSLPPGETFGLLAQFASAPDLYHACEKVRDAGYTRWDAHSPFPVHGLDKAMGLGRSRLPFVTLVCGLSGAIGGFTLQLWANGIAYPLLVSGKPVFNWQPYMPVTFELGVLLAAISTVVGMLAFNELPMHFHPLFGSRAFEKVTDDGFFISIESWDPKFNAIETERFLKGLGASHVELVKRSGEAT
jgi:ActD protein